MNIRPLNSAIDYSIFFNVSKDIYKNNTFHRSTEDDIVDLIVNGKTGFCSHAKLISFIIEEDDKILGRFSLINDLKLIDYIQVAFLELQINLKNIIAEIIKKAKEYFPDCKRICFGLNGHLNYGLGYLADNYNETPTFGLQYTPPYYIDYFKDHTPRKISTFCFEIDKDINFKNKLFTFQRNGYSIRTIDRSKLKKEIEIYTELSNSGFSEHPYWADRTYEEDFELFDSYKYLFREENLLIAEFNKTPVGFLLWFPDFNQLVGPDQALEADFEDSIDVKKFKEGKIITRFRFAEIAILEKHRKKGVELMLINKMIEEVSKLGYTFCEGGYIFEENKESINMAKRYLERVLNIKMADGKTYHVYDIEL